MLDKYALAKHIVAFQYLQDCVSGRKAAVKLLISSYWVGDRRAVSSEMISSVVSDANHVSSLVAGIGSVYFSLHKVC